MHEEGGRRNQAWHGPPLDTTAGVCVAGWGSCRSRTRAGTDYSPRLTVGRDFVLLLVVGWVAAGVDVEF